MRFKSGGYTIFESLIVLAVTGAMLTFVVVAFGGQQRKTQFNQSMRDLESKINDVINDVTIGYYPTPSSTKKCEIDGFGFPNITNGPNTQGTSDKCAYVGKAIHFGVGSMKIHSLVGLNITSAADALHTTRPIVDTGVTEDYSYQYGLELYSIKKLSDASENNGSMALMVVASSVKPVGGDATGVQNVVSMMSSSSKPCSYIVGCDANAIKVIVRDASLAWPPAGSDPDKVVLCMRDDSAVIGSLKGGIVLEGGQDVTRARLLTDGDAVQCS